MVDWPDPGTPVKLTVKTWAGLAEHTGLALPPAGPELVTLKLVNGYNISFPHSYVESVEELDEAPMMEEEPEPEVEQDESLPLVHLIHTGGTIASKVDYRTGAVSARFTPNELLDSVPELRGIARIRAVNLGSMWSDDIRPRHWNRMLQATSEAFSEGAVGVVITHGTDTLHISAAAMSYGWAGRGGRPPGRIVVTGSQRSPDRGSSDAAENLISAVYWAANGPEPTGYRDSSVVVLHAGSSDGSCSVLPGCATRKYHSSRRDAFKPINQEPIAHVSLGPDGPSIEMGEPSAYDARTEAISPMMFDESTRIAQFVADAHLQPDMVSRHRTGPPADCRPAGGQSREHPASHHAGRPLCRRGRGRRSHPDHPRSDSHGRLRQGPRPAGDGHHRPRLAVPTVFGSGQTAPPALS